MSIAGLCHVHDFINRGPLSSVPLPWLTFQQLVALITKRGSTATDGVDGSSTSAQSSAPLIPAQPFGSPIPGALSLSTGPPCL